MTPDCRLAIAPHFHLPRGWTDRVWVRAEVWRPASAEELAALRLDPASPREALADCVCLFGLPAHLRSAFWQMLEQDGTSGFTDFAAEVARFLAFKQFPSPPGAVFELVLGQPADLDSRHLWAVVNLGDGDMSLLFRDVRVRLDAGEGCRVPAGRRVDVFAESEEPGVFLVIRLETGFSS